MNKKRVLVVGGGAAGLMAASSAANSGARVVLLERNARPGRKIAITGKGRCNVTNDCSTEEFLENVKSNPRFLYSAIKNFDCRKTIEFFESAGVPLKTERGRRVFPVSDRAFDIVDALVRTARSRGVEIEEARVDRLIIENGRIKGAAAGGRIFDSDAVILCTGGLSYPLTGSDGDGYRLAEGAGHTVTPLTASLVPIVSKDKSCASLQGLSLKNITFTVIDTESGKSIFSDFGELMFTHFGLTGPVVLSASAHIPDIKSGKYCGVIDLKPALDEKTLDARIISDFSEFSNRDYANSLEKLLPQKMIPVIVGRSGIDPRKKVNSITKEERKKLVFSLKNFSVSLEGFRPISEAIVTKGGICVKEINPKTMESKIISGLYLAGEIIDVDAYTGGFNLQIAFSTGVLAGKSAAAEADAEK